MEVFKTDDGAEGVLGAYGVICGVGEFKSSYDDDDDNGDRVFGVHTCLLPGYKLLVIGCTNAFHIFALGTIVDVAQTFVRLVEPGEFTKALEYWSNCRSANISEYAAVGHSLRMLVAREKYAMRGFPGCGDWFETKWKRMYPGSKYLGPSAEAAIHVELRRESNEGTQS